MKTILILFVVVPIHGWQKAASQPARQEPGQPAGQEKEAAPSLDAAFAFANRDGTELLVTDQNAPENDAVVETFSKAVCPDNKVLDVRFVRHQSRGKEDSGRATSRNFHNLAGSLFHIVEGKVGVDQACLLAPDTYINDRRPLAMKVAKAKGNVKVTQNQQDGALDYGAHQYGTPRYSALRYSEHRCDARTKGGLVPQRGRAPTDCWELAQIDRDGRLLAVLYEARPDGLGHHGMDLLAALVFEIGEKEVGEKHFVYEMPARADPTSSWREGDGGHFDPTTMAPLFVLENDRDGSWDIGISWAGEEGAVLSVYRSAGASTLKKVVSGYVYWYPE